MELYDVIRDRRSIRRYQDVPVAREKLERVLDAARLAPSWKNQQGSKYIVVSDKEKIQKIGEQLEGNPAQPAFQTAPYVLIVCGQVEQSGDMEDKQYYLVDAAISMQNLVLAATAEGLGTCWIGLFKEKAIKDILGIPADWHMVAMTPLGVPDQAPKPRPRQELTDMVYENTWGETIAF